MAGTEAWRKGHGTALEDSERTALPLADRTPSADRTRTHTTWLGELQESGTPVLVRAGIEAGHSNQLQLLQGWPPLVEQRTPEGSLAAAVPPQAVGPPTELETVRRPGAAAPAAGRPELGHPEARQART